MNLEQINQHFIENKMSMENLKLEISSYNSRSRKLDEFEKQYFLLLLEKEQRLLDEKIILLLLILKETGEKAKKKNIRKAQSIALSNTITRSPSSVSNLVGIVTSMFTGSSQSNRIITSLTVVGAKASVKMENIIIPRLLFDKPNTALIKLGQDFKMRKIKGWSTFKLEIIKSTLPIRPEYNYGKDDWLPNDDFIILYTLQVVLELPLNLELIAPAHQPNWDLISDLVSSNNSKLYRSPLDCKKRFENVILKREEMGLTEIQNKKHQLAQLEQQQSEQQGDKKTKQAN